MSGGYLGALCIGAMEVGERLSLIGVQGMRSTDLAGR